MSPFNWIGQLRQTNKKILFNSMISTQFGYLSVINKLLFKSEDGKLFLYKIGKLLTAQIIYCSTLQQKVQLYAMFAATTSNNNMYCTYKELHTRYPLFTTWYIVLKIHSSNGELFNLLKHEIMCGYILQVTA